ncbi:foldase protein PrsA [Salisaeta longa]|uniref:foldase protein PrsA n=1 Tax=Salisaeta longa TaxID=503170 RepID=UPI00041800CB|nr:peptidyl-prolyl cis-trans isomerase [Salisaeta longa]
MLQRIVSCTGLALLVALLAGCQQPDPRVDYVARVGGYYLTEQELSEMLPRTGLQGDSAQARKQIIEQWVTHTLLLREALNRDLKNDPAVREQLREQERAVLVGALTNRLYAQAEKAPTASAVAAYYQQHKEQLRLHTPLVRVRHLETPVRADAQAARDALAEAPAAQADSLWSRLVARYAARPEQARTLSATLVSEARLFGHAPYLRDELLQLDAGAVAPVLRTDSMYHILQVVERIPAGTIPKQAWVEDEIRRRLRMQARKQTYAREVQRLRNEARARNELELPATP